MASGPAHSRSQIPNAPPPVRAAADGVIETQLGRVRRHIRLTDLATGLLGLGAGVLGFLVVLAVVDHWIVGLEFWGRLLALATLIVGAAWHLTVNVAPLLVRHINPAFAAQTIERGEPRLKNSLINYLLLRRDRATLHEVVYQAIQQRAAVDVAQVAVDQTVDRTAMIRAGYFLTGIMIVTGAYKILSPKDPFQTIRRIAAPWSDIARPARVTLEAIQPGNGDVIQGQSAEISVIARGARPGEEVQVIFSTADRQIVDHTVAMQLDSAGLRHVVHLPPGGRDGLLQNVLYRITAGDATSREYRLQVVSAPAIAVERIEYDYPAYTRRPREVVDRQGDLKAVEGTRVTVTARANQSIRSAAMDLSRARTPQRDSNSPAAERMPMDFKDKKAWRTWRLEISGDRQSPRHSSYQITFINEAGLTSVQPITHHIDVVPDLTPEVEILAPEKETVQVQVGGEQKIEVRAIDPDFGLSNVRLKAVCGGRELFDLPLFADGAGQTGQIVVEHLFRPREHQLQAGSQVTYWATAADNKTTLDGSPAPNSQRTSNRTMVIVADPNAPEPKDDNEGKPENSGDMPPMPGEQPKATNNGVPRNKPNASPRNSGKNSNENDADKSKSGENGKQGEKGGSKKDDAQKSDDKQSGGPAQSGQSQSGNSDQEKGSQPKQGGGQNTPTGDSGQPMPGEGQAGKESGGNSPQKNDAGAKGNSPGNDPNANGTVSERQPGERRTEPLHDGEVFDKALERMKQQEQQKSPKETSDEAATPTDPAGSDTNSKAQRSGKQPEPALGETKSDSDQMQPGAAKSKGENNGDKQAKQQPSGAKPSAEKEGQSAKKQGDGDQKDTTPGEGGKSLGGREQPQQGKPGEKSAEKNGAMKQPGTGENGKSGAGDDTDNKQGASRNEESAPKQDRSKSQQPDGAPKQPSGEPPAATDKDQKKQSDSKGGESGDKSGGGKKGNGQGANQSGNDSAGQNSAADDGAAAAKEKGNGETSKQAGDKKQADGKTGKSGDQKGDGSSAKADPNGQQSGEPSSPTGAQPPPNSIDNPPPGGAGSDGKTGNSRNGELQGGRPGDRPATGTGQHGEVPEGDAAKLEYSRRATDMVLDYLKDQKDKPDEKLLDELGWTPDDLRAFLDRWQKLKQAAAENPAAERELNETLRGLGIRPRTDTKRTGSTKSDDNRGLRESGIKSAPPASYREQFDAFKKGASRAK